MILIRMRINFVFGFPKKGEADVKTLEAAAKAGEERGASETGKGSARSRRSRQQHVCILLSPGLVVGRA